MLIVGSAPACGGRHSPVEPVPIPTGLTLSGNSSFNNAGQTSQLVATASFSNGTSQDVTREAVWSTSATTVATISTAGVVTAVGPGHAQITASYQARTATMQVTITAVPPDCVYEITSANQVGIAREGGTGTATFTLVAGNSNCTWTASTSTAWISLADASGSANIAVRYTIAANSTASEREGRIEVRWPGSQQGENIVITQAGPAAAPSSCLYQLTSSKQINVPAAGGSGTITFAQTAGSDCTWTATSSTPWASVLDPVGSSNILVRYTVGANSSASQREGRIEVRWPGSQQGENIVITQAGPAAAPSSCFYQLTSSKQINVPAAGGSGTITFAQTAGSDCTWTATSSTPWASVLDPVGSGNILVRYTVGANSSASQREGRIEVRWPGSQQGENIVITQAASGVPTNCSYQLTSPKQLNIASAGGTGVITFTLTAGTNCTWTATATSAWISILDASGSGNITARYTISTNSGASQREGRIDFRWSGSQQGENIVIVQAAGPGSPSFQKIGPPNGATQQEISLTLSWQAVSTAATYEYCVDTTDNNRCDVNWQSPFISPTSARPIGLLGATTYYWQVRANNAGGSTEANDGAWWSFRTVDAPAPFQKIAPATGTNQPSTSVILSWQAADRAATYEYCVDTTDNNRCDVNWQSPFISPTSARPIGLLGATTYYWQVRANNAGGSTEANDGAWWNFRTVDPPAPFQKIAPANGTNQQSVTLSWQAADRASTYEYCVDTTDNNRCDVNWQSPLITPISARPSGLVGATTYYWQVRANNAGGSTEADSGVWWSFRTAPPLVAVYDVGRTNGSNLRGISVTRDWQSASSVAGWLSTFEAPTRARIRGSTAADRLPW